MATPYFIYQNLGLFVGLLLLLSVWSLIWKGLALWRAGTRKDLVWFIIILIFNTAGILPIIYLLVTKESKQDKPKTENKTPDKSENKTVSIKTAPKAKPVTKTVNKSPVNKKTVKTKTEKAASKKK
ncbi:MAG: DUF5652 family protein [archaeon]